MKIVSHYTLDLIQDNPKSDNFKDLESVIEVIDDLDGIYLENNILKKESTKKSGVIYNENICCEYETEKSKDKIRTSDISSNYFLVKQGSEFLFTHIKPKNDIDIDPYNCLSYLETLIGSTTFGVYNKNIIYSTKGLEYLNSKRVFSFPFGGILKNDCFIFAVDSSGVIKNLSNYNGVVIDYIQGIVYIDSEGSETIYTVAGLFNIFPIKIISKGKPKIAVEKEGFYKFKNINKSIGMIDITPLSANKLIFTSLQDIYIKASDNLISIDNIVLKEECPVFIPSNSSVIIEKLTSGNITEEYSDFTSNQKDIIESLFNFEKSYNVGVAAENGLEWVTSRNRYVIDVYKCQKETSTNTTKPLRINLFE